MSSPEDHRARLHLLFGPDVYATCSCGWVSPRGLGTSALVLAEHAAHVHVAMGWAVADDGSG